MFGPDFDPNFDTKFQFSDLIPKDQERWDLRTLGDQLALHVLGVFENFDPKNLYYYQSEDSIPDVEIVKEAKSLRKDHNKDVGSMLLVPTRMQNSPLLLFVATA